jgi:hypothetical protein
VLGNSCGGRLAFSQFRAPLARQELWFPPSRGSAAYASGGRWSGPRDTSKRWRTGSWVKTPPSFSLQADGGGAACITRLPEDVVEGSVCPASHWGRYGAKVLLVPSSTLLASVDVMPSLEASLLANIRRNSSLLLLCLPVLHSSSLWSTHLGCWCCRSRLAVATWSLTDGC